MQKIYLSVLFSLLCSNSYGQFLYKFQHIPIVKIEKHYKKGVRDSIYREWNKLGIKSIEGYYVNGKRDGKWRFKNYVDYEYQDIYYENGKKIKGYYCLSLKKDTSHKALERFTSYGKDSIDVIFSWHDNGVKAAESHLFNGLRDSISMAWNENGILIAEEHFKKGEFMGLSRDWNDKGQLKNERLYDKYLMLVKLYDINSGKLIKEIKYSPKDKKLIYIDKRHLEDLAK